jgi:hypothetical protein
VSSVSWHVNGALRCTAGSVTAQTTLTGATQKSFGWSCGSWSCQAGAPQATCTVSNTSGYDASAYSFGGADASVALTTSACDAGVAAGGTCAVQVTGTPGGVSGALTASGTPSNAGVVSFAAPSSFSVQGGAAAPACGNTLAGSTSAWSCNAGKARFTATFTNENDLLTATLPNIDPGFAVLTGAVIASTTCRDTTLAPAASCTVTVDQGAPGADATVVLTPSDAYFQANSTGKVNAPNCAATLSRTVVVHDECATLGRKRAVVTLENVNSLQGAPLGTLTAGGTGASIVSDTCSGQTLSVGGGGSATCQFEISWDPAPTVSDASVSISTTGFGSVTLGTGDIDNSCAP